MSREAWTLHKRATYRLFMLHHARVQFDVAADGIREEMRRAWERMENARYWYELKRRNALS